MNYLGIVVWLMIGLFITLAISSAFQEAATIPINVEQYKNCRNTDKLPSEYLR